MTSKVFYPKMFRFHTGSIKSQQMQVYVTVADGFDSILVRLKVSIQAVCLGS